MRRAIVVLLLLLYACTGQDVSTVVIHAASDVTYAVELAQDDAARQLGLMNRTTLERERGMLFVYENDRQLSFWMKNTKIPLDILYINSDHAIVDIQHMVPCRQEPCQVYYAAQPAMYALEINAGEVSSHKFETGQRVDFLR